MTIIPKCLVFSLKLKLIIHFKLALTLPSPPKKLGRRVDCELKTGHKRLAHSYKP